MVEEERIRFGSRPVRLREGNRAIHIFQAAEPLLLDATGHNAADCEPSRPLGAQNTVKGLRHCVMPIDAKLPAALRRRRHRQCAPCRTLSKHTRPLGEQRNCWARVSRPRPRPDRSSPRALPARRPEAHTPAHSANNGRLTTDNGPIQTDQISWPPRHTWPKQLARVRRRHQ